MMQKHAYRWLAVSLTLYVLAIAAYVSDAMASIHAFQQAVARHDVEMLARYVDYPSVRASFKKAMSARLEAAAAAQPTLIKPLTERMNQNLLPILVEHVTSPQGLIRLVQTANVPHPDAPLSSPKISVDWRWHGLNRVNLIETVAGCPPLVLTFQRHGLGLKWRLTRLDFLPSAA